jgi:hypothetical protein
MEPPDDVAAMRALSGTLNPKGALPDPLEAVRRILQGMPRYPDVWDERVPTPAAVRASTPLEAPDTGEINPNTGTSVPAGYFAKLKRPESGGDPRATNKVTGAAGLFQILPTTYAGIRKEAPWLGLTDDIYDEANQGKAADFYTQKSIGILQPMLGRMPTMGELYALHFFGHGGGQRFLKNLDAPAAETLPPSYFAANPWLKAYAARPSRDLLAHLEKVMQ